MKVISSFFSIIISFCIISCSGGDDSSVTTKELDQALTQPNSTDDRINIVLPDIPSNNCYYIASSTIDNSTIDNSSISENSTITNSYISDCSRVSNSNINYSSILYSKIESSSVDNFSRVDNDSYVCSSTIDNATINNSRVCNNSSVSSGSAIFSSEITDNTTVRNGSMVKSGSSLCNSVIDNATIDNSSICKSTLTTISNVTVNNEHRPSIVNVTSSTPNGTYTEGDNISIQVIFSENVYVYNWKGEHTSYVYIPGGYVESAPSLRLNVGDSWYTGGSGTDTLTFIYTVQASDSECDVDNEMRVDIGSYGGSSVDAWGGTSYSTIKDNDSNLAITNITNYISVYGSQQLAHNKDIILGTGKGCSNN